MSASHPPRMSVSRRTAAVPGGVITADTLRALDDQTTTAGNPPADQPPGDTMPTDPVSEPTSDDAPEPETPPSPEQPSPRPPSRDLFGVVPGMAAVLHGVWRWEGPADSP